MPVHLDPLKEGIDRAGVAAATWCWMTAGPDDNGDDGVAPAVLLVDG